MKTFYVKKVICLLMAALTVLGGFVFIPQITQNTATAATSGYYKWGGYATYLKGAGTEASPFLISTPNELAYFRKQVAASAGTITYYANNNTANTAKTKAADTAYYKLTNDIYYNDPNGDEWKSWSDTVVPTNGGDSYHTWAPSGYNDISTRIFEGVFDGNGHTIYGLYIVHTTYNSVGFIGAMRYGTIKNLTLANGYVHGNHQVGAFIGQSRWGTELVNCTSNMRVVGNNAVGGLVGGNAKNGSYINTDVTLTEEATVASLTMYNCVSNSTVSGVKWVGGIMGYVSAGAARVQIEECVNNGDISATGHCVGGILGGTRQADGAGHNVIDTCINNGTIAGQTGGFTGGIVGCGRAIDIYYCQNYGKVSSNGNAVGGISGANNSSDSLANGRIFYCYNAGEVMGVYDVGGIAGGGKSLNINQCANVATVTGDYNIGGILGRSGGTADLRDTEVYDCYNAGKVVSTTSAATVAGIVGNLICEGTTTDNKYAKIKRCVNIAEVTGGRAIAATESALQNDAGTGLFVFTQFNDTCFGLSSVNTNFDGGTATDTLISEPVIEALGGAWEMSYPVPYLKKIDYAIQNYNNRADMLDISTVNVNSTPALDIKVSVDTSKFYTSVSEKALTYGIIGAKTESLTDELTHSTAGAIYAEGALNNTSYVATLAGQTVEDYDDMYTIRPFVSIEENGKRVYIYGDTVESSYYTADGADVVPAVYKTASFKCDEKLYVLVGGSDEIECVLASATDKDSISFFSSDTSVATVSKGVVKGIKAGTATITVTYTGSWGAVTRQCQVTVLEDLAEDEIANQYAAQTDSLRIHTNELYRTTSITKNDGTVVDFNGTVLVVDGGNNNSKQLEYLIELRNIFLADGLASGTLTEAEYYRRLLSNNSRIEIIFMLTHWHTDHINGMRYHTAADHRVFVRRFYTQATPSNSSAAGYTSYINNFNNVFAAMQVSNPNLVATQFGFESQKIRYFSSYNNLSTTDSTLPLTLYILGSRDWSTNSALNTDATEWENSSSMWFVIEYAGKRLLFTGDSYIMDTGTTYTGALTSGNTSVDFMLYKHKNIVDTTVAWMDCNHHGRGAYNENLFTATQPEIVLSTLYYGNDSVALVNKAVTTADVYLGGDREQVFVLGSDGVFNTDGAVVAYNKNTNGKAVRNRITLKDARGYGEIEENLTTLKAPNGVTLSAESLELAIGTTAWLAPTVSGDSLTDKNVTWEISDTSVVTTDGAYITAKKLGTATVTVSAGDYTATCTVNVVNPVGDVNKDGQVTSADCVCLKELLCAMLSADAMLDRADLNEDGLISALDYIILTQRIKEIS